MRCGCCRERKLRKRLALSVEDLTPTEDGRFTILIRRAKNDPEGAGRTARLSTGTSNIVREGIAQAAITRGALLRPVFGSTIRPTYLQPLTVSRVLKKLTELACIEGELERRLSGHSLRVGAAQQLTLNGLGLPQIMRAGGWKSADVVARYIENVDLDVRGIP
ncbi:tyrosine-type recombinase/integrase [Devosia lucknowensis]|uniref:tyrosine-type recombinase/integrase n=1 Tax=Devosia lucknowensis TaxID=1096929 RepID=UPI003CC7CA2E